MLSKRSKTIILIVAAIQLFLIVFLLALPRIVLAIPGRYRVALEERSPLLSNITEGIIDQVAPASAALPMPENLTDLPQISIPTVAAPTLETIDVRNTQESVSVHLTADDETNVPAEDAVSTPAQPTNTPLPSPTPTSTPTPEPLPIRVRLDGITRIQQSFNNCGPANLTQVLNWYGDETSQSKAAAYLKPNPEDRNVSPWQLSDYVNEFTELRSTVHSNGTLEMVKRFLASGFPVVIEKGYEPDTAGAQGWFGHYLTVFGYDDELGVLYSMDTYLKVDPVNGRSDSYEEIERFWQHFNYNFYVVYQPEDEAKVNAILGPVMLEPLKMWENAAIRAQQELEVDPENAFVWFNLGTSLTRMGELLGDNEFYSNGAAAFDRARAIGLPPRMLWYEFRPYLAYMKIGRYDDMMELADAVFQTQGGLNVEETFLYKGHALLFEGDVAGATAAYQRALELNENFYPAEIALQSLN